MLCSETVVILIGISRITFTFVLFRFFNSLKVFNLNSLLENKLKTVFKNFFIFSLLPNYWKIFSLAICTSTKQVRVWVYNY